MSVPILAGMATAGVISGAFGVAERSRLAALLAASAGVAAGMTGVLVASGATIARPSDLVWLACVDAILAAPMLAGFALVIVVAVLATRVRPHAIDLSRMD